MPDNIFDNADIIKTIIKSSNRLYYLLIEKYKTDINNITKLRVDSDNFKIGIFINDKLLSI
jgi:hypothetical protein